MRTVLVFRGLDASLSAIATHEMKPSETITLILTLTLVSSCIRVMVQARPDLTTSCTGDQGICLTQRPRALEPAHEYMLHRYRCISRPKQ